MNCRISVFLFCVSSLAATAQPILTMETAVSQALEKNYNVLISKKTAESAATVSDYAWGAFLPQVNGTASTTWTNTDQEFKFADESRNTSGNAQSNNMAASVQLVWTLFDGAKMFATRERLAQLERQGELAVKEQMVNTIAAVMTNYFNIVRQKQQLRAVQEQMSINEERVKLAERKLAVGIGARPELLQAKVDLNAQKTTALQHESVIVQLKMILNESLGMQPEQSFEVEDSMSVDQSIVLDEILSKSRTSNYSLLAAERNVAISHLTVRERQRERWPIFNFAAAYNFTHNNNIKLINPFSSVESENKGFNYGFTVALPILNGLSTTREIKLANISLNRQRIVLDQLRTFTTVSVRNAFVAYENALKVLQLEEENIMLERENVTIALESFKRGASTYIELRTAQQSLETANNRLITARYNAKITETELLRLSGALLK